MLLQRPDFTLFVAMPSYDGNNNTDLTAALLNDLPRYRARFRPLASSFLTRTFNILWCEALNDGFDYFLMVHADVIPTSPNWIQTLLDEMSLHDADAVSVVMPIKDNLGLTSTALTRSDNSNQRRLTLHECHHLPETFDAHAAAREIGGPPDSILLLNTGLFLVDLKRHRPEIEKLLFRTRDVVQRGDDGRFSNWAWSEDWYWSRDAAALGLKLLATRKVQTLHKGSNGYCNCCDWGTLQHDDHGSFIPEVSHA